MLSKEEDAATDLVDGRASSMEEKNFKNTEEGDVFLEDTSRTDSLINESKEEFQTHQPFDIDEHLNVFIQNDNVSVEESSNVIAKKLDEDENEDDTTVVEEEENDLKSVGTLFNESSQQRDQSDDIGTSEQGSLVEVQIAQDEEEETKLNVPVDELSQRSSQRTETVTLLSFAPSEGLSVSIDENVQEIVEEEEEALDRDRYYVLYNRTMLKYQQEKDKNKDLHRRVTEYYRKRRMFHVFSEGNMKSDQENYNIILDDFMELSERVKQEATKLRLDLDILQLRYSTEAFEVQNLFKVLQQAELEVGRKLESVAKESAGALDAVITQRYLKRQRTRLTKLIKIRLNYIKLENKYKEKKAALDALDNLGSVIRLADYEELKIANEKLLDELEEKENELIKLRRKRQDTLQATAHIKEKIDFVKFETKNLISRFHCVKYDYMQVREELGGLKRKRDHFRKLIDDLKKESGFLKNPKLRRDMTNSKAEIASLSWMVEKCKKACESTALIVERMRMVMASPKRMSKLKAKLAGEKVSSVVHSESTESDFRFGYEDPFFQDTSIIQRN